MKRIRCMKKTNNKGFSLVEVIVVCLIIAVLAAIAAPSLIRYIDNNKEKECRINRKGLLDLLDSARIMNPEMTMTELIAREKDEIICPSGGTYSENDRGGARCSIHGGDDEILMVREMETPVETIPPPTVVEPTATPAAEDPTLTPTPIPTQTPLPETDEGKKEVMYDELIDAASSWRAFVDACIKEYNANDKNKQFEIPKYTIYYNDVDGVFLINIGDNSKFKADNASASNGEEKYEIAEKNSNYTGSGLIFISLSNVEVVSAVPTGNPEKSPYLCYFEGVFYLYSDSRWNELKIG